MPPTIRQIAEKAHVSIATVSRVMNNVDYPVKEDTRILVQKIADELGYQPNILARGLRNERSETIGVVVDNIENPFVPPIVRGIQDFLHNKNYIALIVNTDFDMQMEKDAINILASRAVDGFIFAETWFKGQISQLEQLGKPYVFVHRLFNASIKNSIVPDDLNGAQKIMDYLIGLGHERIAIINGPEDWHSTKQRFEAYQIGLQKHQISLNPDYIRWSDWEVDGGYDSALELLAKNPQPTAIFAANDLMAVGALWAARQLGIRVPEDVSIIGYDNRSISNEVRPRLSTLSLPAYEMGVESARRMWQLLHHEIDDFSEVKIQGELIIRESCERIEQS